MGEYWLEDYILLEVIDYDRAKNSRIFYQYLSLEDDSWSRTINLPLP